MSRILGLWNRDGAPADRELLSRMASTMQYPNHDGPAFRVGDGWGFGCNLLRVTPESQGETQPFFSKSGCSIVFDGRLDNRDELFALLGRDCEKTIADSALVLALFEEKGPSVFGRLIGDFAFAIADPARKRVLLARDISGSRPLYCTQSGESFLFASEVKALMAAPQVSFVPDDEVLAWFLLRYPVSDLQGATFFQGIHSVRPGYFVEFGEVGTRSYQFCDHDTSKRTRLASFGAYAEAFREVFGRAVERRMRSAHPVSLCVSGGLDSSAIMGMAAAGPDRERLRPITHTFNPGTAADEAAFVDELEKHCGIPVVRFPTPLGFRENMVRSLERGEAPLLDEMANCQNELFKRIAGTGSRTYMTGLFGDQVLFDYSYLTSFVLTGRWLTAAEHLRGFAEWYPDVGYEYFRRELARASVRSLAPNWLLNELRKRRSRKGVARKNSWLYSARFLKTAVNLPMKRKSAREFASRHARSLYYSVHAPAYLMQMEIANKQSAAAGLDNSTPFLDRDLVQFLMSIPGEIANYNGVPKAILREAAKPYLPATLATRRAKADGTAVANSAMAEAFPGLVQMTLDNGQVLRRGYLNTKVMTQLSGLQDKIDGIDCQMTFELAEFFGLELWLRCFNQHKSALERPLSASGAAE